MRGTPTATAPEPEVIADAVRLQALPGTDVRTGRNYWAERLGVRVGVDWRGVPSVGTADAVRIRRAWDEAYLQHDALRREYDQHCRLREEEARRARQEALRQAAEREALQAAARSTAEQERRRLEAEAEAERRWQQERKRLGEPPSFEEFQANRDKYAERARRIAEQLAHEAAAQQERLAAQRGVR